MTDGLRFEPPSAGLFTAVAVFGVTGVGTSELFMYPYWCVEKGYARFTGPRDGSDAWISRARGWIRVMHVDIIASLLVYTIATIAFYLLGAGVSARHEAGAQGQRHDRGAVAHLHRDAGRLGAVRVLRRRPDDACTAPSSQPPRPIRACSPIWAACTACYQRNDAVRRLRHRRRWVWVLTVVPVVAYLLVESPVKMVVWGAIFQAFMLPVVAFGTLYLRHRRLPAEVAPRPAVTVALWIACLVVAVLMSIALIMTIRQA